MLLDNLVVENENARAGGRALTWHGPAGRADLIHLRVNQLRGDLQRMYHRNVLESQELMGLIQPNERA